MIPLPPDPPAIVQPPPPNPFTVYGGIPLDYDPFYGYGGRFVPRPDEYTLQFIDKFAPLFHPARYKVMYGGRGGLKSWAAARALLILGQQKRLRIVCGREFMNTIEDSVYKLLRDQIDAMGLGPWYKVRKNTIIGTNGTTFRFVGLGDMAAAPNRTRIKSFEGVDILWIEEAETISKESWLVIPPTIRKAGAEIWVTFNPKLEKDATYQMFLTGNPPPRTVLIETNWRENYWLSKELREDKDHLFLVDPEAAAHVWDGHLQTHADAEIMKGKWKVHAFEMPVDDAGKPTVRLFHGVDWGFSQDPMVCLRCWVTGEKNDEHLWVDREAWGVGVEVNQFERFLDGKMPTARTWPIKCDSARPELTSHLRGLGFDAKDAEKWSGSVEDGIAHLRGFITIHIHPDCRHLIDEASLYRYKVEKVSGEVLSDVVDKHNHGWDALRYALDGFIKKRSKLGRWEKLAR